ncbi:hypothetical protein DFS33DRAFT_1363244 [Desarmillaria ectypa]|nr:hypothetical protein DFS33DRAFT_1363244 [Desarmillaria ectypa]
MALVTLIPVLLLHLLVVGNPINHTIDDTFGDNFTGFQVEYSPAGQPSNASALMWKNASQCTDCVIVPNRSLAMNETWTGATYYPTSENMTARLAFHGSAIYVYLILSNYPKSSGLVSDVICDFRMDGEVVGSYSHNTDGTNQFEYDILAYSNASMGDEDHTLLLETTGMRPSYVIFDYAVYTNTRASMLSPSSPTQQVLFTSSNAISPSSGVPSTVPLTAPWSSSVLKTFGGAVAVGIFVVIILAASFVFYFRRRRRSPNLPATPATMAHPSDFFHPSSQIPQRPTFSSFYDAESSTETLTTQIPSPAVQRQRRERHESRRELYRL